MLLHEASQGLVDDPDAELGVLSLIDLYLIEELGPSLGSIFIDDSL